MADDLTTARLVLRAQVGDLDAFDQLLASAQRPLFRCIRGVLADDAWAEDVLQEVFITIHRKLRWLREPRLFRPWALRIAIRRANRERRKRRVQTSLDAVAEPVGGEVVGERLETAEVVESMLGRVSTPCRDVLVLHYVEGMTLADTAMVLGIPVGTAKSRLASGLESLRRLHPETTESEPDP